MTRRAQAAAPGDVVAKLLGELLAQQRATNDLLAEWLPTIAESLAKPGGRVALAAADHAALEVVLPEIRRLMGDASFLMSDMIGAASQDKRLNGALASGLGLPSSGAERRVGMLFARAAGVDVGGLVVTRIGETREGAAWTVGPVRDLRDSGPVESRRRSVVKSRS